jgi:hypothetical protein
MASKPKPQLPKRTKVLLYESARMTTLTAVDSLKSGSGRILKNTIDLFETAFLAERGLFSQAESTRHANPAHTDALAN